jgi:long-subunit fatty acid transport protein
VVDGAISVLGKQVAGAFELQSLNAALFTPRQLWLGGTYKPVDALLLSLDIGWLNWSAFPSPTATVSVGLDVPDVPFISADQIPPPTTVVQSKFSDIISVRFGLEGTVKFEPHVQLDLRAGYAYEPSPAPDQPGVTSYVDNNKHTVGYGIGLTFHDWNPWVEAPVSLDLAGQVIVMEERTYQKDDPTHVIGDFTSSGLLATFSATVRWRF